MSCAVLHNFTKRFCPAFTAYFLCCRKFFLFDLVPIVGRTHCLDLTLMFTLRFFTLLFLLKDLPFPANFASLVSVNSCSNILKSSLDYLPRSVFLSLQLRVGNTPAIIFFSFSSEACLYATFGLAPSELLEFFAQIPNAVTTQRC